MIGLIMHSHQRNFIKPQEDQFKFLTHLMDKL